MRKFTVLLVMMILLLSMVGCAGSAEKKETTAIEDESGGETKDIKDVKVGDSVFFGVYEQDGNLENGKEEIEWVVLDKQDGKALVISKYALDCVEYTDDDDYFERIEITWEICSLRKWLNSDFYNSSFEEEEQSCIIETLLENHDNQVTGASGGNRTEDKVFVLSIDEVTQYFSSDPDENDPERRAMLTEYAKNQGGFYYSKLTMGEDASPEYEDAGVWWLRSPAKGGRIICRPADVKYDGCVIQGGCPIEGHVVRPAMWIAY